MTNEQTTEVRDWRSVPRSELLEMAMVAVDCARGEALAEGDESFVRRCDEVLFPFLEAELAKEGDGPTPFGKAVLEVARERGLRVPELELHPRYSEALRDQLNGINNRTEVDLCLAVACAVGLELGSLADKKDAEDRSKLAMAWTFG